MSTYFFVLEIIIEEVHITSQYEQRQRKVPVILRALINHLSFFNQSFVSPETL